MREDVDHADCDELAVDPVQLVVRAVLTRQVAWHLSRRVGYWVFLSQLVELKRAGKERGVAHEEGCLDQESVERIWLFFLELLVYVSLVPLVQLELLRRV